MDNKESFKMTYCAQQQEEIERIRNKYTPKEEDKMAQLRALDASVGKKAMTLALSVGIVGALLLGIGMSLLMTDFGNVLGVSSELTAMIGIAVGVVGIVLSCLAYPLYNRKLQKERKKIAPDILRLSEELSR